MRGDNSLLTHMRDGSWAMTFITHLAQLFHILYCQLPSADCSFYGMDDSLGAMWLALNLLLFIPVWLTLWVWVFFKRRVNRFAWIQLSTGILITAAAILVLLVD